MNNSKPNTMTWKALVRSLVDREKKGTPYAFLLGAGASITSGIPGAKDLATRWLADGYEELIKDPKYDEKNIAALYSKVYLKRFREPEDGYLAIEEIMSDDKKVWPSIGYSILAQVMSKTRHNLVLTTNFDRLTETALLLYQNIHARVIAHETMLDVIAIDD
jgi:NAD-dependent SIR2 family protein deacetylase